MYIVFMQHTRQHTLWYTLHRTLCSTLQYTGYTARERCTQLTEHSGEPSIRSRELYIYSRELTTHSRQLTIRSRQLTIRSRATHYAQQRDHYTQQKSSLYIVKSSLDIEESSLYKVGSSLYSVSRELSIHRRAVQYTEQRSSPHLHDDPKLSRSPLLLDHPCLDHGSRLSKNLNSYFAVKEYQIFRLPFFKLIMEMS